MKRIISSIVPLLFLPLISLCQQHWTLDYCIEEAFSNNYSLKITALDASAAKVNLKQSRGAYQPGISFSNSHNYANTPFPANGTEQSKNAYSGNVGLNLNWTIWNGSRQPQIEQARLNLQRAGLLIDELKNSLREEVTQIYTQILYATENVGVQQALAQSGEALRAQGEERLRLGAINQSTYQQLVAQCASDTVNIVQADADLQNFKLNLLQLLEHDMNEKFSLADIDNVDLIALQQIPNSTEIFNDAVAHRPEIQAAKLDIQSSEYDLKIAKAGYMPTLSLTAGTGTGWRTGTDFTFGEQMKNGWSNTAGINISVPIWNGRQTKSAVEHSKIQQQQAELNYDNMLETLRHAIETLWLNAYTAQQQYKANDAKLKAAQMAYELIEQQFNLGQKTATDLLQQRATLFTAQQQKLQAKYNAYYAVIMLHYYAQGL
ncbi:MAG TPA: transporter [Bacteroidales bacterium]|nr:transporter [Bacteroidales bacterium]